MSEETDLHGVSIHKINKFGEKFFQSNPMYSAARDLKEIRARIEALSHSGLFNRCPDVLEKINGAIAGKLADIEIGKLSS